jgi:hypothetical protein
MFPASRSPLDVLGLPDEGRDALMTAALGSPERALDAWNRWVQSGADARGDPIAQRWLPLIGWNLKAAPLDAATQALFRDARRGVWAANTRIIDSARPAIDALHAAGIRTLLLKGAALTHGVYDVPGLRPIGDVDLLVEPVHAAAALGVLSGIGWQPQRRIDHRDRLLAHSLNLYKPPHGSLDVHWYVLSECCWPDADRGFWRRARPLPSAGPAALTLSPADQLLHICLHGLRWSPVHAGHWVADAVQVLAHADGALDWDVLLDESRRRRMSLHMLEALRVIRYAVRHAGGAEVPDTVLQALGNDPVSWRERWECRLKGRPVVSAAGMFVIWAGWRRTREAARAAGVTAPRWSRYLAATVGEDSRGAVATKFALHARHRLAGLFRPGPRRGATTRERLVDQSGRTC